MTLGAAVWVIYTGDHLADAYKISYPAQTPRHRFHQEWFTHLSILMIVSMGFALVIAVNSLERDILYGGIIVSGCAILYLCIVHFLPSSVRTVLHKELMIAFGYTVGILMAPFIVDKDHTIFEYLLYGIHIFLLALNNLCLFSYFEYDSDRENNQKSIATTLGKKVLENVIYCINGIHTLYLLWSMYIVKDIEKNYGLVVFASMLITLCILIVRKKYFSNNERYRIWGDGIFLYPLVLILFW